jgi:hypothetical protein
MENCREGIWKFVGVCLLVLTVLGSQGVRAAEPQPEQPAPPQAKEEAVPEEKPPEKPPELVPGYIPGGIPSAPYIGWEYAPYYSTTFHPGPTIGILAPYGYGATDDTLIRGWQSHSLGPVRVSPYLEYDGLFRTNVFQTTTDKKSDYVNTINPGIRFELPVADRSKLSLGYLGEAFIFSRFGEISHFDQNVNADAALNFSELSIKTGTVFRAATEEPTVMTTPPFTISRQRFYDRTTPYFQAAYTMGDRWRVEANYQFDDLSFAKSIDRPDNYQYNTFGGTIFYKFLPKTSALLQYNAVIRTYPFNSPQDSVVHTPVAGLTWDPTAKLSGTVKFGYTISDFDHPQPGVSKSSVGGFAMSIQTLYHISRYTQLSLVAQRSIMADVDYANQAFYNTGFLLTLTHYWHYFGITSYAAFSYYNDHYLVNTIDPYTGQTLRRNDNIYSFGTGLSRPITRWLRVHLDYLYNDRGSNFTNYTYNEHRVILGLQTSF